MSEEASFDASFEALLATIYERYQYDFRGYARASLRRRVRLAVADKRLSGVDDLRVRIEDDARLFAELLGYLTVQVTEMFRDPPFWAALRTHVLPYLATYPFFRVWTAGVGTGEEAYSVAILLREAGLLDRALVYATDIEPASLATAEAGIYPVERMSKYAANYVAAGGSGSLADHYTAAYGGAALDPTLRKSIVFSDHSLATDTVFAEVQLVICRNVLIYFERALHDRALGLFGDALSRGGYLGLGSKELVPPALVPARFTVVDRDQKLYRRAP